MIDAGGHEEQQAAGSRRQAARGPAVSYSFRLARCLLPTARFLFFTFAIFHLTFSMAATAAAADLRIIHTKHYEIHTDLEATFAAELAHRMDVMYEEYEKRMKDFRPPADAPPLPAYLFTREQDYMTFTEHRVMHTGGVFVVEPDRSFLAAFLNGQGRDTLRRTLQHEAFHQFAYFTISHDLPIWMNEGLAQVFEEGIWTGQKFLLGQVPPRRIRQLQSDIAHHTLVDFKTFLAITPDQWSANLTADANKGATYYNQAWAMVHFLAESGHPDGVALLSDYLKRLHNGEDPQAVFQQAFADKIPQFQDAFADWAASLQPTPEATVLERQDTLGDFLVALAKDGMHFNDMTNFRNTVIADRVKLRYTRGAVKWSTSDTPQIYFADLGGQLYPAPELFFRHSPGSPLLDIICHATPQLQLRTHFYKGDKEIEHEVLIEPFGQ
jgi:Protein of unknown function (DUF1570)